MLEKKIGIIFLADIVDYTPQAVKLGTHKTKSFSDYFRKKLESLSGQYDGKFVKSIGDAVLIFFEDPGKFLKFVEELRERSKEGMDGNITLSGSYENLMSERSPDESFKKVVQCVRASDSIINIKDVKDEAELSSLKKIDIKRFKEPLIEANISSMISKRISVKESHDKVLMACTIGTESYNLLWFSILRSDNG